MAYVDTNVLVAAYAPNDPLHKPSKAFLETSKAPRIISPLTFEELSSVLARTEEDLELPAALAKEPPARRIRAVVEYVIRDSGLTLASDLGSSRVHVGGRSVSIPLEYWKAARLAPLLKLRALDLLHLAYAHLIDRLEFSVKTFVTGDEGIISRAVDVHKSLEIAVKHPKDAV